MSYIEEYCLKSQKITPSTYEMEEFAKNSQTDFAEKCFIRKLHSLQATFARNDVAIFCIAICFPQYKQFHVHFQTSVEVRYLD